MIESEKAKQPKS